MYVCRPQLADSTRFRALVTKLPPLLALRALKPCLVLPLEESRELPRLACSPPCPLCFRSSDVGLKAQRLHLCVATLAIEGFAVVHDREDRSPQPVHSAHPLLGHEKVPTRRDGSSATIHNVS